MLTYEVVNDATGEVVETANSYQDAVGIAAHLSATTKTLHFVPVEAAQQLIYTV